MLFLLWRPAKRSLALMGKGGSFKNSKKGVTGCMN